MEDVAEATKSLSLASSVIANRKRAKPGERELDSEEQISDEHNGEIQWEYFTRGGGVLEPLHAAIYSS